MVGGMFGQWLVLVAEAGQRAAVDRVADGSPQARVGEQRTVGVQRQEVELRSRIDEVLLPPARRAGLPAP
jgi:hypothetical protein